MQPHAQNLWKVFPLVALPPISQGQVPSDIVLLAIETEHPV